MNNLPLECIVSRKPKQYLRQGLGHCGVYSLKAILSAYGKDNKNHPKGYHTNWIGRNLFSFAMGRKYHDKIFASYGIQTETTSAKHLQDEEKLTLLKTLLAQDTPVMIRIGNGYVACTYNPIIGTFMPHWVTLWGYDDDRKLFYIYDSRLPEECWDSNLPIGNTTRTYKEILRDWNFGDKPWHFFSWNTSRDSFLYIRIVSR